MYFKSFFFFLSIAYRKASGIPMIAVEISDNNTVYIVSISLVNREDTAKS